MDLGLKGQVALVTAASRGLGAAVARRFALEGARVALCSRELDHARTAAQNITQETGAEVVGLQADVAVPADVEALVRQTVEHFYRVDILIVNAGGPPAGTFETLKPEQWEQAVQLTLMSAVRCARPCPDMKPRQRQRRVHHLALGQRADGQPAAVQQPAHGRHRPDEVALDRAGLDRHPVQRGRARLDVH